MNTTNNAENKKLEELMRKIRALKAKAEDPSVTEAEAMAFAAKVQEMLATHGLEAAQLDQDKHAADDVTHRMHAHGGAFNWVEGCRRRLVMTVCMLYMTRPMMGPTAKHPWTIVGRPHNVALTIEMAEYLMKTVIRISNEWARETGGNRAHFRKGCAVRLCERMTEMMRAREQPRYSPTGNPQNLPALYASEKQLCRQYMDQHWRTRTAQSRGFSMGGADSEAGRAAADGISLGPQVSSRSGGPALLGRS